MDAVKKYAKERKIPHLVHFTNIKNLESIIEYGLVPRDLLEDIEGESYINDPHRFDGHADSVSLSIAFPNCQMFYSLWNGSSEQYCILGLHPEVLWNYECAFCKHNAADNLISGQNINDLKSVSAFEGMYDEFPWVRSRVDQKLKPYDPTDVQAEVLVFDIIDPKYIVGIVFPDQSLARDYQDIIGNREALVHRPRKDFYGSRSFSREY